GFYCSLICGLLFSFLCISFRGPLLNILGTDATTFEATEGYMLWTVYLGAAPAILNVVMAYLVRAEGASLHASLGTMSGCLLNMILDPVFILPWGLDMGAAGAGLATFLSNCVSCLYFFALLWVKRGRTYVCINPKMFRFKKEIILGICAVGIPASIQNLLNVTSMTVLNNFTAGFGSDAVAAMGIAQKLNMIPMQIAMGFSQGMMPLVGYNYAYGNVKRMKNGVLFTAKCMMSFLAVFALLYYLGAGALVAAFMKNETIVGYGSRFLRVFCLQMPFLCMDFLGVGIYQACGMGKKSLAFAIARKIILEIPLLFIMNGVYPLYGLPYSHLITEVILAVAAVFVLRGIFKKLEARER
ncbi:MAG: MATE family efflux transporter, partial [Firmicutes bacterium]|nr:MATE family efflux transporter [Bacillota bacterium]